MKKRIFSFILILILFIQFMPFVFVTASANEIEADFALPPLNGILTDEVKSGLVPEPFTLTYPEPLLRARSALLLPKYTSPHVTLVKNQGINGVCWAFSAMAAVEANILVNDVGIDPDLSELHLAYATSNSNGNSEQGFKRTPDGGGNRSYAAAYLMRGTKLSGTVDESHDPYASYITNTILPRDLSITETKPKNFTVQNILFLGDDNKSEFNNEKLKRAIMEYGAVPCSMYWEGNTTATQGGSTDSYNAATFAYFYNGSGETNHAVTLVGWDDEYPVANFNSNRQPSSNGAWLVKNSWSKNWGNNGHFWISYEDTRAPLSPWVIDGVKPFNPNEKVYEYDYLGFNGVWGYQLNSNRAANVFKVESAHAGKQLTAVKTFVPNANSTIDIYVVPNWTSPASFNTTNKVITSNITDNGWYTFDLLTPIDLGNAEDFAVIIDYKTTTGTAYMPRGLGSNERSYHYSPNSNSWEKGEVDRVYNIKAVTSGEAPKDITSFEILGMKGTINEDTGKIDVKVPYGTDVMALVPDITHTGASISPDVDVAQDFTTPVTYTVTGADDSKKEYEVTVTAAGADEKEIIDFEILGVKGVITENAEGTGTIEVKVPYGTNLTNITPVITHIGVSIGPTGAQDFTNPVTYTVTAGNGSTREYTVTVKIIKVTGVTLNITEAKIAVDETITLIPTVAPSTANPAVEWKSSDDSIATVSNNGVVTARGEGEATITVETVDGEFTAECKVTILPREDKPTVGIDYIAEKLTGMNGSYSINDGVLVNITGDYAIDSNWFGTTLSIVKKGDGANKLDSEPQSLPIPTRPNTPNNVQGVNETAVDAGNGRITGVTTAMEYRAVASATWTSITGTQVMGLSSGDYQVRIRAVSGTSFASLAADVVIAVGTSTGTRVVNIIAPTFRTVAEEYTQPAAQSISIRNTGNSSAAISSVTVTPDTVFEIGGSGASVPAGGSISTWTIRPKSGLAIGVHTAEITVTYDGTNSATATATSIFRVIDISEFIGIDYASVPEINITGSTEGFEISLTKEALTLPPTYTIAAFSIDGGAKWRAVKSGIFSDATFAKLLNKDLTLHISNEPIDKKTKKPPENAVIVTFPKISKRPPVPKLVINYEIGADRTGATSGDWLLTERNGTTAVKSDIEIALASGKTVDENGWGNFHSGATRGVPVRELTGTKAVRTQYFIRIAPKQEGSGSSATFTAASRPRRINASSELKPLKAARPKTNKTTQAVTISLRKGLNYTIESGSIQSTGDSKATVAVQKGNIISIWTDATAKRPASKPLTFTIN